MSTPLNLVQVHFGQVTIAFYTVCFEWFVFFLCVCVRHSVDVELFGI
jgi:hypothetical protein